MSNCLTHCRQSSCQQFSFKYFLNIAFVRKISPKFQAVLAATGMNGLCGENVICHRIFFLLGKMPMFDMLLVLSIFSDSAREKEGAKILLITPRNNTFSSDHFSKGINTETRFS